MPFLNSVLPSLPFFQGSLLPTPAPRNYRGMKLKTVENTPVTQTVEAKAGPGRAAVTLGRALRTLKHSDLISVCICLLIDKHRTCGRGQNFPNFPKQKTETNCLKCTSTVKSTRSAVDCETHNDSLHSKTVRSQNFHQDRK